MEVKWGPMRSLVVKWGLGGHMRSEWGHLGWNEFFLNVLDRWSIGYIAKNTKILSTPKWLKKAELKKNYFNFTQNLPLWPKIIPFSPTNEGWTLCWTWCRVSDWPLIIFFSEKTSCPSFSIKIHMLQLGSWNFCLVQTSTDSLLKMNSTNHLHPFRSDDKYKTNWAELKSFIDSLFNQTFGHTVTFSFAILFKTVYESVMHHNNGVQLYTDFVTHIKKCFSKWNIKIEAGEYFPNSKCLDQRSLGFQPSQQVRDANLFKTFHKILAHQFESMQFVLDIFLHLDKIMIKTFNTDLKTEWTKMFCSEVCDQYIDRLLLIARSDHHNISFTTNSSVLNLLYQLNPEYALKDLRLFATMMTDQENLQDLLPKHFKCKDLWFGPFPCPTLEETRERGDMMKVWEILHEKDNVNTNHWFRFASEVQSGVITRNQAKPWNILEPNAELDIQKHFFSHRFVDSWNSLPHEIQNSETVNIFKSRYDAHFQLIFFIWSNKNT